MTRHEKRSRAICETIERIKTTTAHNAGIESLNTAKAYLLDLAAQTQLFPTTDFPPPTDGEKERTVCIYKEPGGHYAMYVNLVDHGAGSIPHDHGNSWAIIAGIEGSEKHTFYTCINSDAARGFAELEATADVVVKPGVAVSMLVGGIHSIEAIDCRPSMFLHCYARSFEAQEGRREFDLNLNTYTHTLNAVGRMAEMPLHPRVGSKTENS